MPVHNQLKNKVSIMIQPNQTAVMTAITTLVALGLTEPIAKSITTSHSLAMIVANRKAVANELKSKALQDLTELAVEDSNDRTTRNSEQLETLKYMEGCFMDDIEFKGRLLTKAEVKGMRAKLAKASTGIEEQTVALDVLKLESKRVLKSESSLVKAKEVETTISLMRDSFDLPRDRQPKLSMSLIALDVLLVNDNTMSLKEFGAKHLLMSVNSNSNSKGSKGTHKGRNYQVSIKMKSAGNNKLTQANKAFGLCSLSNMWVSGKDFTSNSSNCKEAGKLKVTLDEAVTTLKIEQANESRELPSKRGVELTNKLSTIEEDKSLNAKQKAETIQKLIICMVDDNRKASTALDKLHQQAVMKLRNGSLDKDGKLVAGYLILKETKTYTKEEADKIALTM